MIIVKAFVQGMSVFSEQIWPKNSFGVVLRRPPLTRIADTTPAGVFSARKPVQAPFS